MTFSKKITLAAGLAVALVIGGCGGGNDGPSTPVATTGTGTSSVPSTTVPDSAGNTMTSFLAFLVAMVSSETSEPLTISNGFVAPSDETSDPMPVS